jgi:hypothetical protein
MLQFILIASAIALLALSFLGFFKIIKWMIRLVALLCLVAMGIFWQLGGREMAKEKWSEYSPTLMDQARLLSSEDQKILDDAIEGKKQLFEDQKARLIIIGEQLKQNPNIQADETAQKILKDILAN